MAPSAHDCFPVGEIKYSENPLYLLHYKKLGKEYETNKLKGYVNKKLITKYGEDKNNFYNGILKNINNRYDMSKKLTDTDENLLDNDNILKNYSKNPENVILTCWMNYDEDVVNPFFNSFLKNFNKQYFNTKLVVFYKNVKIQQIRNISNLSVGKIKFIEMPNAYNEYHINTYRHKLYYDFLKQSANKYKKVLLSDSRDIIFQNDNIFNDNVINKNIIVYAEDKFIGDNNSLVYKNWEESCYNLLFDRKSEEFNQLVNSEYYCAGTILGEKNLIQNFCKDIFDGCIESVNNNKNILKEFSHETCIFNYLINVKEYSNIIKRNNHSDEILTFSRINNFNNLKYDKDNNILNDNDIPFSVLHFNGKMIYPDKIIKKYDIKPYKQSSLNNHNINSVKNSPNKTIIQPTMNFRNPNAIHNMPKKLLKPLNNSRMFRNK